MINLLILKKNLPRPLWKILRWFYHRFYLGIKWDKSLIEDLSEYFGLTEKEVVSYLKKGRKLNADLWKMSDPKDEEEIRKFYSFTPYYIFSLAFWHMQKYQRDFRGQVVKYARGDVLDYGAGIGDLSIDFSKKGLNVRYADLKGKSFEFANWLFKKHGFDIKMIDLDKEALTQEYDTVVCVDVIEHVVNPQDLLKDLAAHIKKGGQLIITNLYFEDISEDSPMHFKIGFDAENYLRSFGFEKKEFPWLWKKI